jgi:hypothetical protein
MKTNQPITLSPKEFHALPKEEKAVLVAKDVIAQIRAKRYIAEASRYVAGVKFKSEISGSEQINKNFDKIEECHVCALGAMLMSSTHLGNKLTFGDVKLNENYDDGVDDGDIEGAFCTIRDLHSPKVQKLFNNIFTSYELLLIETCFEGYEEEGYDYEKDELIIQCDIRWAENVNDVKIKHKDGIKCQQFYEKYENDEDRMIAICRKIIRNKGVFKF